MLIIPSVNFSVFDFRFLKFLKVMTKFLKRSRIFLEVEFFDSVKK